MKIFLENINIKNFKSIKSATLSHCSRINLLIGRPNLGKSNILEALELLGLSHIKDNRTRKITQFLRLENEAELFFDGDSEQKIIIETNRAS